MVVIETFNWGDFEASTLELASKELIECLGQHGKTSFTIDAISINGETLDEKRVIEISRDIEHEIYTWIKMAEIESEGLRRAQQEAMEG
jgi:hypothetical protein